MMGSIYTVVNVLNAEPEDVAVFDNEEAALDYAKELAEDGNFDLIRIHMLRMNNVNMQVTLTEFRK